MRVLVLSLEVREARNKVTTGCSEDGGRQQAPGTLFALGVALPPRHVLLGNRSPSDGTTLKDAESRAVVRGFVETPEP